MSISRPKNPTNTARESASIEHGISCSCPRCIGLRRYPQPSLCDWCKTIHAGDASNCPVSDSGNGNTAPEQRTRYVHWAVDNDPELGVLFNRVVTAVERGISHGKQQIRKELRDMGLKDMLSAKGGGAGNLLKGSDVPSRIKSITIEVEAIREAPDGFTAPAIVDLKKEVYGATAWAVNKTNLKAIIKHFGDDEKKIKGKKIKLDVISVRNPQSGDVVPSLAVSPRQ